MQDSKELKSFADLKESITGGQYKKPKKIAELSFSSINGKIFYNGLNIVHNCVLNLDGIKFIYRDTKKAGKHFAIETSRGIYLGRVFCSEPGNYVTKVLRDYMDKLVVKSEFDKPIELETNPVRIALRQRGIFPSKRMIVEVRDGTPLTYSANQPMTRSRVKAPAGSRSVAFTSDGLECFDEHSHPGIKDSPVTGKVRGATFLIQYSTIFGKRGRPRRWLDKVIVTPGVQMVTLEQALDRVMNVKERPERLMRFEQQQQADETNTTKEEIATVVVVASVEEEVVQDVSPAVVTPVDATSLEATAEALADVVVTTFSDEKHDDDNDSSNNNSDDDKYVDDTPAEHQQLAIEQGNAAVAVRPSIYC